VFVRVPSRQRRTSAWVTPLFAALSLLAFLWLLGLAPEPRSGALRQWGAVPQVLLGDAPWLNRLPALVTALFIHANWLHLTGNLLFLLVFGLPAERALGSRHFLALFLGGGALANYAAALAVGEPRAVIIGSSGAVSALIGAYLALFPRARLGFVLPLGLFLEFVRTPASLMIGFWALLQLIFTFVGPGFGAVAWPAHLAGFVLGLTYGLSARPLVARRLRESQ